MRDNEKKPSSAAETPISDEIILKLAKEIAVKFIEVGRISPASFASSFAAIYQAIEKVVREGKP